MQWVYERKLMAPPTTNSSAYEPIIYNNKLYAWVGKNIVCHNLDTGEQIWRKSFPQDFLFSGFIIEDDKIIANNEDTFTYCLNPENGNYYLENGEFWYQWKNELFKRYCVFCWWFNW